MKESVVRDFLVKNFSPFIQHITNLGTFKSDLEDQNNTVYLGGHNAKEILISDLIRLSVNTKLLQALPLLENLELIDKEVQLLSTGKKSGKQPSIDLMAYNTENYCIALIELKVSDSAEREAVTELSAYNQGLHNKYRGLSSFEVLWIPISTEWRVTTKSAISFQMYWQNIMALPLKMRINSQKGSVVNLNLECFDPIKKLTELECINLFSYECFDAFDYCFTYDIADKNAFVNYVSGLCSRNNIHGFIIFHKPVDMMFKYGFTLCIYNPYKGYLHKRLSEYIVEENGENDLLDALKNAAIINTQFADVNFKTDKLKHWEMKDGDLIGTSLRPDAYWHKTFLSIGDFAENSESSNIHHLFEKIKERVDSNGVNPRALGTPNFERLFRKLRNVDVDFISYLGIHSDLVSNRILIEHRRKLHSVDFFKTYQSIEYLKKIFRIYNLS